MNKFKQELLTAIENDKGEMLKDAATQLLRQAARGDQWAIQELAFQLSQNSEADYVKP